eukprot:3384094-Prymnesium_polylepis.1
MPPPPSTAGFAEPRISGSGSGFGFAGGSDSAVAAGCTETAAGAEAPQPMRASRLCTRTGLLSAQLRRRQRCGKAAPASRPCVWHTEAELALRLCEARAQL